VKDERLIDRFDRVFALYFHGLQSVGGELLAEIPEDWLRALAEKYLSPEELAQIQTLGGFDKLLDTLRQRLAEQQGRHEGGSKWIGTAGTSPFGAYGANPEGIRIGQDKSRNRRAVKAHGTNAWDKREFKDLDGDVELGTRAMKLALRGLRRWGREGEANELDLGGTIRKTAENAGSLDIQMRPERRNKIKVLLLLDIGGSMDDHIEQSARLFSAAKSEFKHLETWYFHNCPYERLWRDNRRRYDGWTPTMQVLNTYGADWSLIFVGDATMSPYEITESGGSVEYWNEEAGSVWLGRFLKHYPRAAWINPREESDWGYTRSLSMIRQIMAGRMYPLTLDGLDDALRALKRPA
jgi:uncharacterized protein with von Willebrand factor type A (vWA) domain